MGTSGVAFGVRVVLLHRTEPLSSVPAQVLLPGQGISVREQARSANVATTRLTKTKGRKCGGVRTLLSSQDGARRRIVRPGEPTVADRMRARMLDVDPAPVDVDVARRIGGISNRNDLWRYEVLADLSYWRGRIAHLAENDPGSELLALLEDRPSALDEPMGRHPAEDVLTMRAQTRLDSMVARQKLMNSLQGAQYADAATLAQEYPAQQEFLTTEVALALGITESAAGQLLSTGHALATRLPGTLAALEAGQISKEVAAVMVGATAVVDDDNTVSEIERLVLPTAPGRSRESVRQQVNRQVVRLDPAGADERHRKAKKQSHMSKWSDTDGMGWMKIHAPMEDIAAAWEAITGLAKAAKTPGDERSLDQRRVDVFADVWHGVLDHGGFGDQLLPTQHGRKAHIDVMIPYDVLFGPGGTANFGSGSAKGTTPSTQREDAAREGGVDPTSARPASASRSAGVAELRGYGPIAPGQAQRVAAEGVWRRLIHDPLSGTLMDYGTTRYVPPDTLKEFVVTRDQECPMVGCRQVSRSGELDHAVPFSKGGSTSERNLTAPCKHHHRAKDGGGWTLVINDDRSKTWTSPLGRQRTKPATRLVEPAGPGRTDAEIHDDPAPF